MRYQFLRSGTHFVLLYHNAKLRTDSLFSFSTQIAANGRWLFPAITFISKVIANSNLASHGFCAFAKTGFSVSVLAAFCLGSTNAFQPLLSTLLPSLVMIKYSASFTVAANALLSSIDKTLN